MGPILNCPICGKNADGHTHEFTTTAAAPAREPEASPDFCAHVLEERERADSEGYCVICLRARVTQLEQELAAAKEAFIKLNNEFAAYPKVASQQQLETLQARCDALQEALLEFLQTYEECVPFPEAESAVIKARRALTPEAGTAKSE